MKANSLMQIKLIAAEALTAQETRAAVVQSMTDLIHTAEGTHQTRCSAFPTGGRLESMAARDGKVGQGSLLSTGISIR